MWYLVWNFTENLGKDTRTVAAAAADDDDDANACEQHMDLACPRKLEPCPQL